MSKVFGYGEDALTLWLLKNHPYEILKRFKDRTEPCDCLVFYRPSFGRSGGSDGAEFGEFDAILASRNNIYLIESKWDNHRISKQKELVLRSEQTARHEVLQWYLANWSSRYGNDWKAFVMEKGKEIVAGKKIAPTGSLLAKNLQQILSQLHEHCPSCTNKDNIRNVLLFFHSSKSNPPQKTSESFNLISVIYEDNSNYVKLA
jgi:hypothetical protein